MVTGKPKGPRTAPSRLKFLGLSQATMLPIRGTTIL